MGNLATCLHNCLPFIPLRNASAASSCSSTPWSASTSYSQDHDIKPPGIPLRNASAASSCSSTPCSASTSYSQDHDIKPPGIPLHNASAASSSSSTPCTPSTSDYQYHDVFINHRGPDAKDPFATSLYRRLTEKGLQVFLDKPEMQVGHNILSQIQAAIRVASVHVAIFSPRYAESEWCLNELLWMMETGKTIIPVFYKVKPEHLRRTKWTGTEKDGPYAIALRKHEQEQRHGTETIQQWIKALKDVANISGLENEALNGDEEKAMQSEEKAMQSEELLVKVVQRVLEICPERLYVAKHPTGLAGKFKEFETTVLSEQQREHREGANVVGIMGLGGIGKTTLARYFFNLKRSDYRMSSFLFDVKENAKISLNYLQSKLIKELKHREIVIKRWEEGIETLKKNLKSWHALIILDDVDHIDQLNPFLPIKDKDILDPKSLIVVTSRNRDVLRNAGIVETSIYHLRGLTTAHSRQLFCSHAFCRPYPLQGFQNVVDGFITACDGLPLSLKVLGALLCGKNDIFWKDLLNGLNEVLHPDIVKILRISYDSLNEEEQQIFLDIACFCIGDDRDRWIRIWGGSGWKGFLGIQNLESKCLVEFDNENRIRMHDHLRDMARIIADSQLPRRLWHPTNNLQDIHDQWEQSSTGTTQVRGIRMMTSIQRSTGDIQWSSPEVLALKKLQLLEAVGNDVQRILEPVQPSKLIWLCWRDCQDFFLPSWVPLHHLRVLEVYSWLLKRLWTTESRAPLQLRELIIKAPLVDFSESIKKLKHLEKVVAHVPRLTALPDDFDLPFLKYLKICSYRLQTLWQSDFQTPRQLRELVIDAPLVEFPKSLGQLVRLEKLVATSTNLTTLPKDFHFPSLKYLKIESKKMERLWQSDYQAPLQLRELTIWAPLVELPESLKQLEYLEKIVARNTSIATLPENFDLPSLKYLHLRSEKLQRLWQCESQVPLQLRVLILDAPHVEFPKSLSQLKHLELLAANGITLRPDFSYLPSLKYLLLSDCEFEILPGFRGVLTQYGRSFREETDVSPRMFRGSSCNLAHLRRLSLDLYSVEVLPNFIWNLTNLERLDLGGCFILKTLPDSLGKLTNLQHLELESFTSLRELPESLCKLTNLQHIDLNGCSSLEMLPDFLGTLTSLQHIDLSLCNNLKTLPDSFVNLTNLQHLNLDGCIRLENLPYSLGNLTSLLHIDFCKSLGILPNSFGNQLQLEYLSLKGCSSLTISSETLGNFTKLKCLDLSCKTLKIPPNLFGNLLQLEHLHLQGCSSLTMSSETLENISELKCLDLSGCLDTELLPPKIGRLLPLKKLNLLGTNLKELPRDLESLSKLEVLRVGSPLLEVLPPSLGCLTNLKKLWLRDCDKLQCLPDSVELLSQLTELKIWNCGIQYLPPAVMKMNNLKLLGVYVCPLRELPFKRLPLELSSALLELQKLELYRTEVLKVSFPRGVCPKLEDMSIVHCERLVEVGALPTTLKNLNLGCCGALSKITGVYGVGKLEMLDMRGCYDIEVEKLDLESPGLVLLMPRFPHNYHNYERDQQVVWNTSFCDAWTGLATHSEKDNDSQEIEESVDSKKAGSSEFEEDFEEVMELFTPSRN